jgi:uncharacterized protein (DUF1684 family)
MTRSVALLLSALASAAVSPYEAGLAKWREQKEAELRKDGGWLTVTGLFWLKEGSNRVEGAPGVFELHAGKTLYRAVDGAIVEMKPDARVTAGTRTFSVIERSGRYGVRMKDTASKLRTEFRGQRWFPARESYRVTARFVSYPQPQPIAIVNILGDKVPYLSPGYVMFHLNGRELRLDPVTEENKLFFIFRDQTAGKETYDAGRFLYTELPRDGKVELDFNKAENPPCAFTPYATCPRPPKQNVLPVRIEAGELAPRHLQ